MMVMHNIAVTSSTSYSQSSNRASVALMPTERIYCVGAWSRNGCYQIGEPDFDEYSCTAKEDAAISAQNDEHLSVQLLRLIDQVSDIACVHRFHHQAVEALIEERLGVDSKVLKGLAITNDWLRGKNEEVVAALEALLVLIREQEKDT